MMTSNAFYHIYDPLFIDVITRIVELNELKTKISSILTGRLAAKIARKESLSLKLALRPDRQELINRNILQLQTDNERQETKEAIGAKLIR